MIILVDNLNFAIRLCEDPEDREHIFISTELPDWQAAMKINSDIGATVVVNGKVAEDYLDAENIYYIHVEQVAKESFVKFVRRMERMIIDNEEMINMNDSSEKLIFGINKAFQTATNIMDDNIFTVTQDRKTGEYFTRFQLSPTLKKEARVAVLKLFERKFLDACLGGANYYGVEEDDFYDDINYSSGMSLREVAGKLHMFIAVLEASRPIE